MTLDNTIEQAAKVLFNADALLITAGAGLGVDSGLPDFRGDKGFWKDYPPTAKRGLSLIEMANPQWFDRNPKLAWAFYSHLFNLYRNAIPHHGFLQLLEIARSKKSGYFVLTSNVDGQFQKAG
ncbi:MAG TPA: NAD-dependent deacetylase, partial [Beggiatoa sp.]|nr:NAD-dependent deacetylase [Beggiatoa sp.]